MRNVFPLSAALVVVCGTAQAAQFTGSWSYTTKGGKGDPTDFFSVTLFQKGAYVCGQVEGTSMGGNRVDFSKVIGRIVDSLAEVEFESGFNTRGNRGLARVELRNGRMQWRVTRELSPSYIWDEATLKPEPWEEKHKNAVLNWCKANWGKIERGVNNDIDLQP